MVPAFFLCKWFGILQQIIIVTSCNAFQVKHAAPNLTNLKVIIVEQPTVFVVAWTAFCQYLKEHLTDVNIRIGTILKGIYYR